MSFRTLACVLLLCVLSHSVTANEGVPYKHTCLAAREFYKSKNPEVDFNLIDPAFHYKNTKQDAIPGREWPLDLCDPPALYPDNSACNCTTAVDLFKSDYPQLYQSDPFSYWISNYLTEGLVWHCERCTAYSHFATKQAQNKRADITSGSALYTRANSTSTTGSGSTSPPSLYAMPAAERCLAAILDFWMRVPESRGNDPMWYYTNQLTANPSSPPSWNGGLCDYNPVYLSNTSCQCDAAKQWYTTKYPESNYDSYNGNPFNHYLQFGPTAGAAWHAELCPGTITKLIEIPPYLGSVSTCVAARQWYSNKHPSLLDPVYYFLTYGINSTNANTWATGLCDATSVRIDDPVCSTCASTVVSYKAQHADAAFYYDPFLHYWNNYLHTGFHWNCTACVPENFNGTAAPTQPVQRPTPRPFVNDSSCTCLAARNDYYSRYPDVDSVSVRYDAVYHYMRFGIPGKRTWNCEYCDRAPQQLDQATCDCAAASDRFTADMNLAPGTDAFSYWKDTQVYTWHCELCVIPEVLPVQDSCNCLAASTLYNYGYPEIQEISPIDPYYYHRWFGYKEGKSWNCDVCSDPRAHYATEHVCDCPEATAAFRSMYPTLTAGYPEYSNVFAYWSSRFNLIGNSWNCLSCSTRVAIPSTSLTCNCTDARADYLARYNDVTGDPWIHYTVLSSGTTKWDCEICNDTCVGALPKIGGYAALSWGFPEQVIPPDTPSLYLLPGCYMPLTGNINVNIATNIYIYGIVRCNSSGSADVRLAADKIFVYGSFQCGTITDPFPGSLKITLHGVPPASEVAANATGGNKALVVLGSGILMIHGGKRSTWTRIATTAYAGDQSIQMIAPVDWQVGDLIVIASTDIPSYIVGSNRTQPHSEEVVISAIDATRTIITLSKTLVYTHLGQTQNVIGTNHSINQYAEVGLISMNRNIIITGDNSSLVTGYGAQVVILETGKAFISGVIFAYGGQAGMAARYPVHWYNNSLGGQYFKNSTIINSFNRCLVMTAANSVTVTNNLCYNSLGSGFVLDTGLESGNIFDSNLVLAARRPSARADYYAPEDISMSATGSGPVGFLIKGPNNALTNNVVADSVGTGYWYKLDPTPAWPNKFLLFVKYGTCVNNSAHSMYQGFVNCPYDNAKTQFQVQQVESLSIYRVDLGFYNCITGVFATNMIIAESQAGVESGGLKLNLKSSALVNYFTTRFYSSSAAIRPGYGDLLLTGSYIVNYDQNPNSSVIQPQRGEGFSTGIRLINTQFTNSKNIR